MSHEKLVLVWCFFRLKMFETLVSCFMSQERCNPVLLDGLIYQIMIENSIVACVLKFKALPNYSRVNLPSFPFLLWIGFREL